MQSATRLPRAKSSSSGSGSKKASVIASFPFRESGCRSPLGSVRDEPCHRCAPTRDRDLFTRLDPCQQSGQLGLGLADVDDGHVQPPSNRNDGYTLSGHFPKLQPGPRFETVLRADADALIDYRDVELTTVEPGIVGGQNVRNASPSMTRMLDSTEAGLPASFNYRRSVCEE